MNAARRSSVLAIDHFVAKHSDHTRAIAHLRDAVTSLTGIIDEKTARAYAMRATKLAIEEFERLQLADAPIAWPCTNDEEEEIG